MSCPAACGCSSLVISHHHSRPIPAAAALDTLRSCAGTLQRWHWLLTHLLESSVSQPVSAPPSRAPVLSEPGRTRVNYRSHIEAAPVTTQPVACHHHTTNACQLPTAYCLLPPQTVSLSKLACSQQPASARRAGTSFCIHHFNQSPVHCAPISGLIGNTIVPRHAFLAAHFALVIKLFAPSRTPWPNLSRFALSPPGTVFI